MDEQKISPFYRTSSPIGAAAPLQPNFNPKTIKRGKGTADHMMPLGAWLAFFLIKNHFFKPTKGLAYHGAVIPYALYALGGWEVR